MIKTWKEKLGFGRNRGYFIGSPMEGEACSLDEVKDPTFSERILGDGIAIKPSMGRVVAPVDGTVAILFETKHAITIISEQDAEILIHIGLDTVYLRGEYFKTYVNANDKVKAGDLLIEFDLEQIKKSGYDVISPIVICNTASYKQIHTFTGNQVKQLEKIISLKI